MPDLRLTKGDDYYKNIRKLRTTPSEGSFQHMPKKRVKQLSKEALDKRWEGKRNAKHIK